MRVPPNTYLFHDYVTAPSFCDNVDIIISMAASCDI